MPDKPENTPPTEPKPVEPELRKEIKRLRESEDAAWVLIANAYDGDWNLPSEASGWTAAAERWRDAYIATLPQPLPGTIKEPIPPALTG